MLPAAAMFPDVSGFSATRGPRTGNEAISNYRVQAVDPLVTLSSDTLADGPVSSLGASAAVKSSGHTGIVITGFDGSPDASVSIDCKKQR